MNVALLQHLWRSPAVRRALWSDSWRYFVPLLIAAGIKLAFGNSGPSGRADEHLAELLVFVCVWTLLWLISLIRTVRKALRMRG